MMRKSLLAILLTATVAYAVEATPKMACTLSQEGPVKVTWKAYKTPFKVGVGGTFDKALYTPAAKEGKNFKEILVGSTLSIDESSVDSGNKGRDAKLVKFFFDMMAGTAIKAKIITIQADKIETGKPKTGMLTAEITMNNIPKQIPMKYSYENGTLTAQGTIDIFDFKGDAALHALNIACFEKHQGKTWNDVTIGFTTKIKALCEPVK